MTELLLERGVRVIGVDADPAMVEKARERLGDRAEVVQQDLLELDLDERVDGVFSCAVFHWITDHERLFERLRAVLKPGGRLIAQCGGHGNIAKVVAAVPDRPSPWLYATAEDTERRLRAAGFSDIWCWLTRVDVDPGDPFSYLRAICLGSFVERLPEDLRDGFVAAALERLPDPLEIHYVRLNILARAPVS